jgi:hypothetical protein
MKAMQLRVAAALLGASGMLSASGFGVDPGSSRRGCEHAADIRQLVHAAIEAGAWDEPPNAPDESWCASLPPLPQNASLEVVHARWDGVLHAYEFRLRCQSPSICLPFLVSWPASDRPRSEELAVRPFRKSSSVAGPNALPTRGIPLVKPGQMVTLVWAEGGLHLSRKVVCLDLGRAGQQVRIRAPEGGRIVRARVASAGLVEADL